MNAPIISGAFDTPVGALPGRSCLSLHAEAALGAVADAGLRMADIDGLLCAYSLAEPHPMLSGAVAEYLGITPAFEAAVSLGGATAATLVMQAGLLVASGTCRHVLVVTGDNRLSGMSRNGAVAALAGFGHPQFEQPYGISIPAAYGLVAQRYMHEFGLTLEQLAAIAVQHRTHAARHPHAHMRAPITLADVAVVAANCLAAASAGLLPDLRRRRRRGGERCRHPPRPARSRCGIAGCRTGTYPRTHPSRTLSYFIRMQAIRRAGARSGRAGDGRYRRGRDLRFLHHHLGRRA